MFQDFGLNFRQFELHLVIIEGLRFQFRLYPGVIQCPLSLKHIHHVQISFYCTVLM